MYIPAVKAGEGGGWRIIPKEDDPVYMYSFYTCIKINIWLPMPLFLDIYLIYRYSTKVDEEKIYTYNSSIRGLLVVLSARCGIAAWMNWICIDDIVLGFKW